MISDPSTTTWTPQFLTLEKVAPRFIISSSTRNGTTFVNGVNGLGDLVGFYNSDNGFTHGFLAKP